MTRAAEVVYAMRTADSLLATYQDAIDDFQVNFNATLMQLLDTQVSVLPPTGVCGQGTNVPLLVTAAGAAGTGVVAMTSLPPNCAALFKKSTASGGRTNRGRTYLPFCLSEAQISENGTLSAGEIAAFQGQANTFLAQLTTDNTPLVIENRVFDSPTPPRCVININGSGANVTSYTIESVIATQRRRLARK